MSVSILLIISVAPIRIRSHNGLIPLLSVTSILLCSGFTIDLFGFHFPSIFWLLSKTLAFRCLNPILRWCLECHLWIKIVICIHLLLRWQISLSLNKIAILRVQVITVQNDRLESFRVPERISKCHPSRWELRLAPTVGESIALRECWRHPHLEGICHELGFKLGLFALVGGRFPDLGGGLELLGTRLNCHTILTVELAERVRILVAGALDLAD